MRLFAVVKECAEVQQAGTTGEAPRGGEHLLKASVPGTLRADKTAASASSRGASSVSGSCGHRWKSNLGC